MTKHRFLVMSLALLLFILAACGAQASTITGSSNPAATVTEPPTQHCGTIHTLGAQVIPADQKSAKGIEDCFWQAYQQCHPATLVYSQGGVDTATIHNFSLKSLKGQCVITDALQHVVFPQSPKSNGNNTCAKLTQESDGLHFLACGNEGDLLVPENAP